MTAARSTFRLAGVDPARLELVIADNDQTPSVERWRARWPDEAPFPVRYVHEPAAGVSNARNAAMSAARGGLIAFLDDDNEAEPGWLAALLEAQDRFDADVVFGPVGARAPAAGPHAALSALVLLLRGAGRGRRERRMPTAAAARWCAAPRMPASGRAVRARAATRAAARTTGCSQTMRPGRRALRLDPRGDDFEDPVPERLRLSYALARAFAYGQGPTQVRMDARQPAGLAGALPTGWRSAPRQALVFGALAAAQWLVRAPDRAFMLDRAVRGLGKVFFGGPFVLRFYGRSAPAAS